MGTKTSSWYGCGLFSLCIQTKTHLSRSFCYAPNPQVPSDILVHSVLMEIFLLAISAYSFLLLRKVFRLWSSLVLLLNPIVSLVVLLLCTLWFQLKWHFLSEIFSTRFSSFRLCSLHFVCVLFILVFTSCWQLPS